MWGKSQAFMKKLHTELKTEPQTLNLALALPAVLSTSFGEIPLKFPNFGFG